MNAIVELPEPNESGSLMKLIERMALSPAIDIARIEQLLAVKERWEANEARKAFTAAMAQFKANPPKITKDKTVSFPTNKGPTQYDHATLGNVADKIVKGLASVGISHRWNVEQKDGLVKVSCILTHAAGHSESVSMHSAVDNSGSKNDIQAIGSAVTYLSRYTLLAATGLATEEMDDDDGRGTAKHEATITAEQVKALEALMTDVGADRERFMKYVKLDSMDKILACNFETVKQLIESKRRRAK